MVDSEHGATIPPSFHSHFLSSLIIFISMSRSQPPNLPMHGRGMHSNGFDTRLVPRTARTMSLTRENVPNVNGAPLFLSAFTPREVEVVKYDTITILQQIQVKLSQCRLTKAQEGMKKQIFSDLDRVADVLLTVLKAHHNAASGIQHIINNSSHPRTAEIVEGHLTSAWAAINKASDEFDAVRMKILARSKLLKEGADISPGFLKRQAHTAINRDLPGKSTFPSLCVGLATLVVNSAAAAEIAQRLPSAVIATNILAVLTIAFGSAMQFAKYVGGDAAIYEPTARDTTKKALECIDQHLVEFSRALSTLQSYWDDDHSPGVKRLQVNGNPHALLRIVQLLEKHVDDCLVVINAIQNLSGSMTVFPTRMNIEDERNGIGRGMLSMPNDLY